MAPAAAQSGGSTDGDPVVSITAPEPVSEGNVATFTLSRTGPLNAELEVAVQARETRTRDGRTAVDASVAYTTLGPRFEDNRSSVVFASGASEASFEVQTGADDSLWQPNSWLVVKVMSDDDARNATQLSGVFETSYEVSAATGEAWTQLLNYEDLDALVQTGITLSGDTSSDYTENATSPVGTYTVSNIPATFDGDTRAIEFSWAVASGADGDDFSVTTLGNGSGQLSFNSPPDYENPTDADSDNTYTVTLNSIVSVLARNEILNSSITVTVTVSDVDENTNVGGL